MKFIISIAGLGGFLYGVDFGVIAAAEPYMKAMGVYTDAQISHIVGAVLLGGLVSSITAGWLSNFFGRKKMIVASAAMFLVAIPIVSLSLNSYLALYAGRVLQGMSAGYMAVVMPMYLTETLPPTIRGRGTGVFQFCLGLGLVVAAGAGCLVATWYGASDKADAAGRVAAWGANFWWTMLPVAVLFLGSLKLPESPVWLSRGSRLAVRDSSDATSHDPRTTDRRHVRVLWQNDGYLVCDKPAGLVSCDDPKSAESILRAQLGETFVAAAVLDHCITLYSPDEWEKLQERLAEMPLSQARKLQRYLASNAEEVQVDAQGRILLPRHLLAYA